jgi:poly(A) polymerase
MIPFDINIFPDRKGVYIVGGSIRDLICDRTPFDYDVVVQGDPASFAKRLASKTSGRLVELGKHEQTMRRVITRDLIFDIMPLNGTTIEEDLLQRDFTINAMAVAVSCGSLIDRLGGRQDLASKKIRMVFMDVFRKDPVRLIRAYRMAAAFDFSIDPDTRRILARDAHLISGSAGERVREEFFKILQCAGSHAYLADMARQRPAVQCISGTSGIKKLPAARCRSPKPF